jgi:hypothetical protein
MHLKKPLLSQLGVLKWSNSKPGCRVSALHFNGFLTSSSLRKVLFSASYSWINPRFTARKQFGVWNSHANRRHRKTTIFTPVVYGWFRAGGRIKGWPLTRNFHRWIAVRNLREIGCPSVAREPLVLQLLPMLAGMLHCSAFACMLIDEWERICFIHWWSAQNASKAIHFQERS